MQKLLYPAYFFARNLTQTLAKPWILSYQIFCSPNFESRMTSQKQDVIRDMFDRIAPTYDGLNRLLSFGQDSKLRKAVVRMLPARANISILDAATGTADLLLTIAKMRPDIKSGIGIDLSEKMLSIAEEKLLQANLMGRLSVKKADASCLPFADHQFDAVTIAFGIRNITRMNVAINEFARVLNTSGSLLILEFSLPKNKLLSSIYLLYFRHILPFVGGLISRDKEAYRYLNRSVEAFPAANEFKEILLSNGFRHIDIKPLCFGVATLYHARKSNSGA